MNKHPLSIVFFIGSIITGCLFLNSCYYDSEEYLFPELNSGCDTTNVTYSTTIQPMLQSYCYSCHRNSVASGSGGGIKLEDFNDVKIAADNGSLLGSISHNNGYSPMPKGGTKLADCKITQTHVWIENGALND